MARKQNPKQNTKNIKHSFKYVSDISSRRNITKKNKNIPHTKNKTLYNLPVFSFNKVKDYYKQFPKGSKKEAEHLRKIVKEAKEIKRHNRKEKLLLKDVDKQYKLKDVEKRTYKVRITKGKRKGKYKTVSVQKVDIPNKQFYGCEKIITNRGDIFFLKYKDDKTKRKAIRTLLQFYEFESYKVLGLDINAYQDLDRTYISNRKHKDAKLSKETLAHYRRKYRPK